MKLPSIQQTTQDAGRTLRRFPFVIADAFAGTVASLIMVDTEMPHGPSILYKILFAAVLGIPLLVSTKLVAERNRWSRGISLLAQILAVGLLAAYATTVPRDLDGAPYIYGFRQALLAAGLCLLMTFAAYFRSADVNAFWQYNRILFLRVFTAAIYSGVLFAGLSLALAALDHLFGMNVPFKRYGELWVLIVGMFATWFTLAGIPEDLEAPAPSDDYPKMLRIFAQRILLPLVVVYLVILYAYMGKIIIEWDWPQGWVSKLILGFSATGIIAFLLLHPLRESVEHGWVGKMLKWYFVVLVPLTAMLFLALLRRDTQYGLTEGRYIGFVCCFWLLCLSAYFIVGRKKSIKFIPVSMCAIIFLISFGPWGMFSVSERSQIDRLKEYLAKNGILADGKVMKAKADVPFEDFKQISSVLLYLHDHHGYDGIQPWFREMLRDTIDTNRDAYKSPSNVALLMGVTFVSQWQDGSSNYLSLSINRSLPMDIDGYDRMARYLVYRSDATPSPLLSREMSVAANRGLDTLRLIGEFNGSKDSLTIPLTTFTEELFKRYEFNATREFPPDSLSLISSNDRVRARLYFERIQLNKVDGKIRIQHFDLDILYGRIK